MIPIVTVIALDIGFLLSGALITETVFAWPGMGKLIFDAIMGNDYNLALLGLMVITVTALIGNFLADIAYAKLDPRICLTQGDGVNQTLSDPVTKSQSPLKLVWQRFKQHKAGLFSGVFLFILTALCFSAPWLAEWFGHDPFEVDFFLVLNRQVKRIGWERMNWGEMYFCDFYTAVKSLSLLVLLRHSSLRSLGRSLVSSLAILVGAWMHF